MVRYTQHNRIHLKFFFITSPSLECVFNSRLKLNAAHINSDKISYIFLPVNPLENTVCSSEFDCIKIMQINFKLRLIFMYLRCSVYANQRKIP